MVRVTIIILQTKGMESWSLVRLYRWMHFWLKHEVSYLTALGLIG